MFTVKLAEGRGGRHLFGLSNTKVYGHDRAGEEYGDLLTLHGFIGREERGGWGNGRQGIDSGYLKRRDGQRRPDIREDE